MMASLEDAPAANAPPLVSMEAKLMGVMCYGQNAPNFKKVKLVREQFNFKDKNAVLVQHDRQNVGHVDKTTAKAISYIMDNLEVNINWLVK